MFTNLFPYMQADDGAEAAGSNDNSQTDQLAAQPQANKKTYEVEFLGEKKPIEIDLNDEEAVKQILQKSLNHDRLAEKWEESKTPLSQFEAIARKAGFVDANGHGDYDAYTKAAEELLEQTEKENYLKRYDNNASPEIVEKLYMLEKKEAEREAAIKAEREKNAETEKFTELCAFFKEVNGRELDPEKDILPKEVWETVAQGSTPKEAYAVYLVKQLSKEKSVLAGNAENAEASAGSVTGKANADEKEFFTSEELDKLTDAELSNPLIFKKAMASMQKLQR